MPWLKLTVAYDGAEFSGWQLQPGRRTVQGVLELAWEQITQEQVRLTASGRTDAGVHALGQVVSLQTGSLLPPDRLRSALNAVLPGDVVVDSVEPAPPGFHATYDALRKTYRYQIHNHRVRPLFDRHQVWHIPTAELDQVSMQKAGSLLIGRHDFSSFETAGSERTSSVRTILALTVERRESRIEIEVTGDGFLYNMVRAIAGTLVEVGRGARPAEWVKDVLAARDRRQAGPNAPPQGLVLVEVFY